MDADNLYIASSVDLRRLRHITLERAAAAQTPMTNTPTVGGRRSTRPQYMAVPSTATDIDERHTTIT